MTPDDSTNLDAPPSPLYLLATAAVRHVLTAAFSILAAHGVATPGGHTAEVVIGSSGALVMLGWSWFQKLQHSQYIIDLETDAKARIRRAVQGSSKVVTLFAIAAVLAGAITLPACASAGAVRGATVAETAAVQAVHATIQTEAAAYAAGAYDRATHEKYLRALQTTVQAERALNDALLGWAQTQNQPMPTAVVQAVRALAGVLNDLQPLIPKNSAAATLAASLTQTISLLTGASAS
jgi:hypothetical protein